MWFKVNYKLYIESDSSIEFLIPIFYIVSFFERVNIASDSAFHLYVY